MKKMSLVSGGELEIARVLASLGGNDNDHNAAEEVEVEVEGQGSGGGEAVEGSNCWPWGSKGKRSSNSNSSSKRVKGSSSSNHSSSPIFPFDLNVDQATLMQEECENGDVKMEEVCESDTGLASHPSQNSGRSRHNLTEAEKEARRIRRILANRESARQTIRRRQAFHEELTRKAAELASENESLKRNKELAIKEFQALQNTNQRLKGQLSRTLGFKLGQNKGDAESSSTDHTHNLHPSANWSRFSPFMFPTCVSSSDVNLSHSSHQQLYGLCKISDQDNVFFNMNGEKLPWCILPCPVLLPMANIKDGVQQITPTLATDNSDDGSFCKHLCSPSSVIHCMPNCSLILPADKNTQSDQINGFHQQSSRSPCCSRGELSHEREEPHLTPEFSSAASSRSVYDQKKNGEVDERKEGSAVAGAEARKKRKELMKLKSRLHFHLLGRANS